jgi:hypothetical protein
MINDQWSMINDQWSIIAEGHWLMIIAQWLIDDQCWSMIIDHWPLVTGHWGCSHFIYSIGSAWTPVSASGEGQLMNFWPWFWWTSRYRMGKWILRFSSNWIRNGMIFYHSIRQIKLNMWVISTQLFLTSVSISAAHSRVCYILDFGNVTATGLAETMVTS